MVIERSYRCTSSRSDQILTHRTFVQFHDADKNFPPSENVRRRIAYGSFSERKSRLRHADWVTTCVGALISLSLSLSKRIALKSLVTTAAASGNVLFPEIDA